ncbi:MAG: large subunit ribosomal protein L23 [Candidatus Peregrinibacteria bacterium Gr01-1014_25]|nr:MAG: large subunit ribosomal protein L23 [Candidatus Peregrinibacteria bacterium Gr01-1014_25]
MDLTRVITGVVATEKAERLKSGKTYTLRVDQNATKIDVKNALRTYFNVDASSVRMHRIRPKTRLVGQGRLLTKRHREKRCIVTLAASSKALDISQFRTTSR